jgi:hypothetical protein
MKRNIFFSLVVINILFTTIFCSNFVGVQAQNTSTSKAATNSDLDRPVPCLMPDTPDVVKHLLVNKQATLKKIEQNAIAFLNQNANQPYFFSQSDYGFVQIGNLFSPTVKHAVVAYLSDAFTKSPKDGFKANVLLYEIKSPNANEINLVQSFKNLPVSGPILGISITDFNLDQQADLLLEAESQDEQLGIASGNDYYYWWSYQPQSRNLLQITQFNAYPNPIFVNHNFFYTTLTSNCGSRKWFSQLYYIPELSLPPTFSALIKDENCGAIAGVYRVKSQQLELVADEYRDYDPHTTSNIWLSWISEWSKP